MARHSAPALAFIVGIALALQTATARETATGVWARIGPEGDAVCPPAIADAAPHRRLLIAGGLLYASADGGTGWQRAGQGLPEPGSLGCTLTLDRLGDRAYLSTRGGQGWQIYASNDGGLTFRLRGPQTGGLVTAGAPFPVGEPGTLLAPDGTRIWRSVDDGENWTLARVFPLGARVRSLAVDPGNPNRVLAATSGIAVYASTDAGATWQRSSQGLQAANHPDPHLAFDPRRPSRVFISGLYTLGALIYRSTDGGRSWMQIDRGLSSYQRVLSVAAGPPSQPDRMFAVALGAHNVLLHSTDAGLSWSRATDREPPAWQLESIGDELLAHGPEGLFRSLDGGRSWQLAMRGIHQGAADAILPDPRSPGVLVIGMQPQGLHRTFDGGLHWQPLGALGGDRRPGVLVAAPQRPRRLFVAIMHRSGPGYPNGGVARSLDRGASFRASTPLRCYQPTGLAADPLDFRNLLLTDLTSPIDDCANCSAHRSKDGGASWECLDSVLPEPAHELVFTPSGVAYASGRSGLARSTDGGSTWSQPVGPRVWQLAAVGGDDSLWATAVFVGSHGTYGLLRSRDGGTTWEQRPATGLPAATSDPSFRLALDPLQPDRIYAAFGQRVFASEDGGASFTELTGDLAELLPGRVTSLAAGPGEPGTTGRLYLGTSRGLFSRPLP